MTLKPIETLFIRNDILGNLLSWSSTIGFKYSSHVISVLQIEKIKQLLVSFPFYLFLKVINFFYIWFWSETLKPSGSMKNKIKITIKYFLVIT